MTRIYIETKNKNNNEYVFFDTLLQFIGKNDYEIIPMNGKDNLRNNVNKMMETTYEGGKNIILLDADTPENKGGYQKTKVNKETELKTLGVTAKLFLIPNNSDDGDLEILLEQLMQKQTHKVFFDCYHDYEICLGDKYYTPNRKGMLHTYITAQKGLTNKQRREIRSGKWLFEDTRFWDLNNNCLDSLKRFLIANV